MAVRSTSAKKVRCIEVLRSLGLVGAILGLLLCAAPARAGNSSCQLVFKDGAAIVDASIDGQLGTDWSDAGRLDSGSTACLNDLPGSRKVAVHSKADASYLYMAFDVQDSTQNTTGGGQLKYGEQLVVQFDPGNGGGSQLGTGAASDYRIVVMHKWGAGSGGTIQAIENKFFNSATTPGNSVCGVQDWSQLATSPVIAGIAMRSGSGGYVVELKIPRSSIGATPTAGSTIGLAFAVIDDIGSGTPPNDAVAVAFPTGMPVTSGTNSPATLPSWCIDWLRPDAWGTGFFPPRPTVTISANPQSITRGASSTLTWSSTGATSCTASGAWQGAMATSGTQSTGALTRTSTFTLTCVGLGGSASASATVRVNCDCFDLRCWSFLCDPGPWCPWDIMTRKQ